MFDDSMGISPLLASSNFRGLGEAIIAVFVMVIVAASHFFANLAPVKWSRFAWRFNAGTVLLSLGLLELVVNLEGTRNWSFWGSMGIVLCGVAAGQILAWIALFLAGGKQSPPPDRLSSLELEKVVSVGQRTKVIPIWMVCLIGVVWLMWFTWAVDLGTELGIGPVGVLCWQAICYTLGIGCLQLAKSKRRKRLGTPVQDLTRKQERNWLILGAWAALPVSCLLNVLSLSPLEFGDSLLTRIVMPFFGPHPSALGIVRGLLQWPFYGWILGRHLRSELPVRLNRELWGLGVLHLLAVMFWDYDPRRY